MSKDTHTQHLKEPYSNILGGTNMRSNKGIAKDLGQEENKSIGINTQQTKGTCSCQGLRLQKITSRNQNQE